jgi:hypothetical protein
MIEMADDSSIAINLAMDSEVFAHGVRALRSTQPSGPPEFQAPQAPDLNDD